MKISRVWAMPNRYTFTVTPIMDLIRQYTRNGQGWVDPFAGYNSPAEFTNDTDSKSPAKFHMDAIEFLKTLYTESANGILLDPPYSLHQAGVSYDGRGEMIYSAARPVGQTIYLTRVYDEASRIVRPGGYAISFGWGSNGLSRKRRFEIQEVLLVAHGGHHNDTIVTVERKIQGRLDA